MTRRHNPSWVGLLGWLGGPGVGLSFARSRERRRQRAQMDHTWAQPWPLSSFLVWLGWVASELAPEGCAPPTKAQAELQGCWAGQKGQAGRGLLPCRELTPGTASRGPAPILAHQPLGTPANSAVRQWLWTPGGGACGRSSGAADHPQPCSRPPAPPSPSLPPEVPHVPALPSDPTCVGSCALTAHHHAERRGVAWPVRPRPLRGH